MSLALLEALEKAHDEKERGEIFFEHTLSHLEGDLRAALEAAAIPHWFDAEILAELLGEKSSKAQALYGRLCRLSFTEERYTNGHAVHEAMRQKILARLWSRERDRYHSFSRRALNYFERRKRGDTSWYVEAIYHRMIAEPQGLADHIRASWSSWYRSIDFVSLGLRAIAAAAREHAQAGRFPSGYQRWTDVWKAMSATSNGERVVALALEGGGMTCAYQSGVYAALTESDFHADLVVGESWGTIVAALIASRPKSEQVRALRQFWDQVSVKTSPFLFPFPFPGIGNSTVQFGVPGLFRPRTDTLWTTITGQGAASGFYDLSPLRSTLLQLIDFDALNHSPGRLVVSAVNAQTGDVEHFDNRSVRISVDHIMACCSLPPAFPATEIDGRIYWDASIATKTPLQYVLDFAAADSILLFQAAAGTIPPEIPSSYQELTSRLRAIGEQGRSRLIDDYYRNLQQMSLTLRQMAERVPEGALDAVQNQTLRTILDQPAITVVNIRDREASQARPEDFSATNIQATWERGYRDAKLALEESPLTDLSADPGVTITNAT